MVAAEIGAVGWLLVAINGAADLFDVLPFGALGAAGAVVRLAGPLPRRGFVALLGACTLATVAVATSYAVLSRSDALVGQRLAVDSVMDVLPRKDGFLSVNAPDAMFLAGRTNPTPWQVFNGSEDRFINAHYPGGLAGYARWVARIRPGSSLSAARIPSGGCKASSAPTTPTWAASGTGSGTPRPRSAERNSPASDCGRPGL